MTDVISIALGHLTMTATVSKKKELALRFSKTESGQPLVAIAGPDYYWMMECIVRRVPTSTRSSGDYTFKIVETGDGDFLMEVNCDRITTVLRFDRSEQEILKSTFFNVNHILVNCN
jgi:hypothetical protein